MVKAFGIFEGGGAKGLAHVGALSAAEEAEIEFIGVAGSSAGSIVAALVAAGYRSEELFDPFSTDNDNKCVFDANFIWMFGFCRWQAFRVARLIAKLSKSRITQPVMRLIRIAAGIATLVGAVFVANRILDLSWTWIVVVLVASGVMWYLVDLFLPLGILSTSKFENWLNSELRRKITPRDGTDIVKFHDLKISLKVISTDLISREPVVFPENGFEALSVAHAVRCSMAIPGVFAPHRDEKRVLVDGGVLSNFPAWVYDNERLANRNAHTIGFRLQPKGMKSPNKRRSFFNFFLDLGKVFFGDNPLQIRGIDDLHLIPMPVSATTLDFDLSKKERRHLFNEGYVAANKYFRYDFAGPKNLQQIHEVLGQVQSEVLKLVTLDNPHLRVNIAVPVPNRDALRIRYTFNMDDDPDDDLRFAIGSGAIGECWLQKRAILVDMRKAKKTFKERWKMDKYQQALVRSSLRTLLSVPIFSANRDPEDDLQAVLSIDSDDDIIADLFPATQVGSVLNVKLEAATLRIASALRR